MAYFRYITTKRELDSLKSPDYTYDLSEQFYTFNTHPEYMVIQRDYQGTRERLRIAGLKCMGQDSSDLVTFWEAIDDGEYDFTFIDHENRMLFECTWEKRYGPLTWSRRRGGTLSWDITLNSPFPWTSPFFAFYPVVELDGTSIVDHTITAANNLVEGDGATATNAGDSNVLRKNGYAMTLASSATQAAYYNSEISWRQRKGNASITLFLQFRTSEVASGTTVTATEINNGSDSIGIYFTNTGSVYEIEFKFINSGVTGYVTKTDGSNPQVSADKWYDLCFSYDAINDMCWAYVWPSGSDSDNTVFEDFLADTTTSADNLLNTITSSPEILPVDTTWTEIKVLEVN